MKSILSITFLFTLLAVRSQQLYYNIPHPQKVIFTIPAYYITSQGTATTIGDVPPVTGGNAPYQYNWQPATYLSNTTVGNPVCTPQSEITYTLTVTDANGCSYAQQVQVLFNASNSIKDPDNLTRIAVYPNPANDRITIDYSIARVYLNNIDIVDNKGKLVESIRLSEHTGKTSLDISMEKYSSGTYFLRFSSGSYSVSKIISVIH